MRLGYFSELSSNSLIIKILTRQFILDSKQREDFSFFTITTQKPTRDLSGCESIQHGNLMGCVAVVPRLRNNNDQDNDKLYLYNMALCLCIL